MDITDYRYYSLGAQTMLLLNFQYKHDHFMEIFIYIHLNSLCVNALSAHISYFIFFFLKTSLSSCDIVANEFNDVGFLYLLGWHIYLQVAVIFNNFV